MTIRHVILDRDGVLNREDPDGGYVERPDKWRWEEGALDALRRLAATDLRVSVATNQSCVGRGLATMDEVDAVNQLMLREAAEAGGRIDAVFVCPHAPEDHCDCRKPEPGLYIQAITDAGIPSGETLAIGDAPRDLEAAAAAGTHPVLVRTGKGRDTEASLGDDQVPVYDHVGIAIDAMLGGSLP
jgi:D-glycero-D-manno-heptose 1,7-bisphosphate phosphatase